MEIGGKRPRLNSHFLLHHRVILAVVSLLQMSLSCVFYRRKMDMVTFSCFEFSNIYECMR